MADIIHIGHTEDTGRGKKLNTGALRRSYSSKKKKKLKGFKIRNCKYTEGK